MKTIGTVVQGREVYFLRGDQSVREAARYMTERRIGAVAVLDGTRLAGIFSERDIMGRVVARRLDPDATMVGDVMTREPMAAEPEELGAAALGRMERRGIMAMPVIDGGKRVVGVVHLHDLMRAGAV